MGSPPEWTHKGKKSVSLTAGYQKDSSSLSRQQTPVSDRQGWGGQSRRDLENSNRRSGFRSLGSQERIKNAAPKEYLIIPKLPKFCK